MSISAHPSPPFPPGTWTPTKCATVSYGKGSLANLGSKILKELPDGPILLLTGKSLSQSTLIEAVKEQLGDRLATVFAGIGQHAPIANIKAAIEAMGEAKSIVSFGGGSVIDSGKAISYFYHEKHGRYLPQVAIPTVLSAAEGTCVAGFTSDSGKKTGVRGIDIAPKYIIYDPEVTTSTPERLWLSTGIRAVDHSIEALYRPSAAPVSRSLALAALRDLFYYLPISKANPDDLDARAALQVAAWQSLGNEVVPTAIGLSHALGHRLGATYAIPHGITSCITLPSTIRLISKTPGVLTPRDQYDIHLAVSSLPSEYRSTCAKSDKPLIPGEEDGIILSRAVAKLVADLGLSSSLKEYKVPPADFEGIATTALKELVGWSEERKPAAADVLAMLETNNA